MTLLERLKIETQPAHDRIERDLDIELRTRSRSAYRTLLARFYGFHAAWEPRAEAALGEPAFFRRRSKIDLLVRDLRALGLEDEAIAALPLCDRLMPLPDRASALGAMYVVEGSTLGGAIIARQVERTLGLTADSGCAYFRSYGSDVGPMWKAFGAKLLAASTAANDEAIIASANRTFAVMHAWLADEQAALAEAS